MKEIVMIQTTCCIVGGGPAGVMLALLLARQGVPVALLEAHKDFERDFRGNTINPAAMQVLDELGLASSLLQLKHAKIRRFIVQTANGPLTFADFSRLKTGYPYVTMLPQAHFLEFIVARLRAYPHAQVLMGANVQDLVVEDGVVHGVRYRTPYGPGEVRALLTVGADGRFSRVRKLSGLTAQATAPPIDVLWFNLPRSPADPEDVGAIFRFGRGSLLVLMDHFDRWQVGYIIEKGSFPHLRAAGLAALRQSICELVPEFAGRMEQLASWKQCSLLSVESNHLSRWYRHGLLLIGDAAHVTSPVGGVGINLAIQDAVVAANLLGEQLRKGRLRLCDLKAVQAQRSWQTRVIQAFQTIAQWQVAEAFDSRRPFAVPPIFRLLFRTPLIRDLPAWLIAFGVWPARLKTKRVPDL